MVNLVLVLDEDADWLKETSGSLDESGVEAVFVRSVAAALTILGLDDPGAAENRCLACNEALLDENSIRVHKCKSKVALSKLPCIRPDCGEEFLDVLSLSKHQKKIHNLDEYTCPVCLSKHSTVQVLGKHKKFHSELHEKKQLEEHLTLLALENLSLKQARKGGRPGLLLTRAKSEVSSDDFLKKILKEKNVQSIELVSLGVKEIELIKNLVEKDLNA